MVRAKQVKLSKLKVNKKQKLLSQTEERHLLKLAQEYRRLQQIEADHESDIVRIAGYLTLEDYNNAYVQGKEARETLITRNIGLVQYCITTILASRSRTNRLRSLSREDLIQEGCIGLSKAIDKFHFDAYDNRFSTYATWWVKSSILRSITEFDDLVRVPEGVLQNIQKSKNAAMRIGIHWDALVTSSHSLIPGNNTLEKMIANEAGLTLLQVQKAIRAFQIKRKVTELEPWMIATQSSSSNNNHDDSTTTAITTALSTLLKPKEMQALSLRYGLIQPSSPIESNQIKSNKPVFRDYLAEAEQDLFGQNGILQTTQLNSNKPSQQITKQEIKSTKGKWGEAMTFAEIGKQMAISTEYSRRLCSNALLKLQSAVKDGKLLELQPLLYSM